jgi:26S proteasome regulatory subunit T5
MSTLEDLDDLERDGKKEEEQNDKNQKPDGSGDADMKDADEKKKDEEEDLIDMEILNSSTRDIISRHQDHEERIPATDPREERDAREDQGQRGQDR